MAETDERAAQADEMVELAEGYLADAEFREDYDVRQLRYLQATCQLLLAISVQNRIMIDLLAAQRELGTLSGD